MKLLSLNISQPQDSIDVEARTLNISSNIPPAAPFAPEQLQRPRESRKWTPGPCPTEPGVALLFQK